METKFATLEQQFDSTDNSIISMKRKSPLVGIATLAAGVISTALVPLVNTEGGTGGALLIVLAITFFVWGLLSTFIRRKYYYHIPAQSRINFKEIFFESENFLKISRILENNSYIELEKIPQTIDKGIKLRIAFTPDKSVCFVQLLKYVPFEYEVQSKVIELTAQQRDVVFKVFKL